MRPLEGLNVLAPQAMAERALCRFLATLGATVVEGEIDEAGVARADFLVENLGIAKLSDGGITRSALEQWNPALVHVSVTPFGSSGARARWRGGELVASAMGGTLRLTGQPERRPVKEALDACTFHADMVAAAGAMAAHYSRLDTGRGQHVDVSIQEVAFSRNVSSVLAWQFDRRRLHRAGGAINYGKTAVRCIWRLADGWCFHSLMTGRFGAPANQALSDWIDEAGLDNPLRDVDWLEYNRSALDDDTRAIWEGAIAAFFATRTRANIRTEGRERGINACVVEEPADVVADPHLIERQFWRDDGGIRLPGRFARLTAASGEPVPAAAARPAPAPAGARSTHGAECAARSGPLAGIRVLDFSWALVGSITTKILGDLGADVVKVESRNRPCLSRIDVQVGASQRGDFDDKPWFAHLNTSKRSLALDLKRPEAMEVVDPLLEWADAVVENFSPGTMARLGLDYSSISVRNPGVVMASGSVYGQTGPLSREWGVDGTGGALSGRTFLTGWPDTDPVIPGAVPYGDVIVPYVMAACVIAALAARRSSGHGCHIDASMYEICVQQMMPAIRAAQLGSVPQRMGNADASVFDQDLYPTSGEDRWVAITLFDESDRRRLDELAGGRPIADWSREQDDHELVALLQREGIAAGVVQDIEDLIEKDLPLMQRGALVDLPHPKLGSFGHVRTPIDFSGETIAAYRAPGIGEHSREVAMDAAHLDAGRIDELETEGVFT
ncbi:MAG: CoA transferase [Gammaproteobacteria bacterium]|jgi:crotonobetainyl-CoA:carnitine CoA-transferase CaiB-like acyl-CoA transferase